MITTNDMIQRIDAWIAAHSEEIIADLQAFSRIRSVSRSDLGQPNMPFGPECREMLDFALARGAEYGFEVKDHEGYCGSVWIGDPDNALGLFGHLDVVPEGDQWIYPPYGATRVGDFLIGRGVGDNKSACVTGVSILRLLRDLEIPMKHGVRVVFGCSEETGMQDMDYFSKTQTMPVISFVPDAGFPVNYAQKGTLRGLVSMALPAPIMRFIGGEVENMVPPHAEALIDLPLSEVQDAFRAAGYAEPLYEFAAEGAQTKVRAQGVAAHAAHPEAGRSAIHMLSSALAGSGLLTGEAMECMKAIQELSSDYYGNTAGIGCEDPETGKSTMVIGIARTEAGRVYLNMDCRLSIATDLEKVQSDFRAYCDKLNFNVEKLSAGNPFYMSKTDPRVLALMEVYREMTGDDSPAYTMGGGTYSRCLKNALTFGPGFGENRPRPDLPEHHGGAHAPDEYVYLPDLLHAMKIFVVSMLELDAIV